MRLSRIQQIWRIARGDNRQAFRFDRPLLLIQSDDWGRVGIRDRQGFEQLKAAGIPLGENPYDFYTLETGEDVDSLAAVLQRHRDSTGHSPRMAMNFVLANLDFARMASEAFTSFHLLPLARGLPGHWHRPKLFEAYRKGIADGVFYPALHGVTHFCRPAVEKALARETERAELLRKLWRAETPYIYWRMPWVGYEYWDAMQSPRGQFLNAEDQHDCVQQAARHFLEMFGWPAVSACAPGYRANRNTRIAWAQSGIKVCQNGPGELVFPHIDEFGILNLHRSVSFEPATEGETFSLESCLHLVAECFKRGIPAIVSVHSINFHSSLRDFRSATLDRLDSFLTRVEAEYPEILYLNDAEMYELCGHGSQARGKRNLNVKVSPIGLLRQAAGRIR